VGKFFAEAIEDVNPAPEEAAWAAGATPAQVVVHAVWPQVLPQLADVSVYRGEYKFRASTVMGMVGAGGIGFARKASLRLRAIPGSFRHPHRYLGNGHHRGLLQLLPA
jgi:phosphonate transport system permease protein